MKKELKRRINEYNKLKDKLVEDLEDYYKNEDISFNERFETFKETSILLKEEEPFILSAEKGYPEMGKMLESDWIQIQDIKKGCLINAIDLISFEFTYLVDLIINKMQLDKVDDENFVIFYNEAKQGLKDFSYTYKDYKKDLDLVEEIMYSNIGRINYNW